MQQATETSTVCSCTNELKLLLIIYYYYCYQKNNMHVKNSKMKNGEFQNGKNEESNENSRVELKSEEEGEIHF